MPRVRAAPIPEEYEDPTPTPSPEPEPEEPVAEEQPYKARQKRAYKMTDARREQLKPILEKGRAVRAANVIARRVERDAEITAAVATKATKTAKIIAKAVGKATKEQIKTALQNDDNVSDDESITAPKTKPRRKIVEIDPDDSADEIVVKRAPRRASTIKPRIDSTPAPPRAVSAPRPQVVFF